MKYSTIYTLTAAAALGIGIAILDLLSTSDDAPIVILGLILVSGVVLGAVNPRAAWASALVLAPWVCAMHLVARAIGLPDQIHPNTVAAILLLFPVMLVAAGVGAGVGAVARLGLAGGLPDQQTHRS